MTIKGNYKHLRKQEHNSRLLKLDEKVYSKKENQHYYILWKWDFINSKYKISEIIENIRDFKDFNLYKKVNFRLSTLDRDYLKEYFKNR